MKINILCCQTR